METAGHAAFAEHFEAAVAVMGMEIAGAEEDAVVGFWRPMQLKVSREAVAGGEGRLVVGGDVDGQREFCAKGDGFEERGLTGAIFAGEQGDGRSEGEVAQGDQVGQGERGVGVAFWFAARPLYAAKKNHTPRL